MSLAPDTNHICYYVHSKSFQSWIPLKSFSLNFCQLALREFHPPSKKISLLWRVSKYPVLQRCNITKQSYKSSLLWNRSARYLRSGLGLSKAFSSQHWLSLKIRQLAQKMRALGCSIYFFFWSWTQSSLQLSLNLLDLFSLFFFLFAWLMFSYHFMLILHLCVPHHISECIEIRKREARQKSRLIQSLKYILLVASASNSMTRLSRHCCTPEGYFKTFFCSCSSCISPSEVCFEM